MQSIEEIKSRYGLGAPPRSVPAGPVARRSPGPAFDAVGRVRELAPLYDVDADLALGVMKQESGGRHYDTSGGVLTSSQGARGYFQVLPDTGKQYGFDVDDPEQNIEAGLRYLSEAKNRFNGNRALMLASYHSGLDDAEAAFRNPAGNPKTHNYIRSILGSAEYYQHLHGFGASDPESGIIERLKAKYTNPSFAVPASEAPAQQPAVKDFAPASDAQFDAMPEAGRKQYVEGLIDNLRSGAHLPKTEAEANWQKISNVAAGVKGVGGSKPVMAAMPVAVLLGPGAPVQTPVPEALGAIEQLKSEYSIGADDSAPGPRPSVYTEDKERARLEKLRQTHTPVTVTNLYGDESQPVTREAMRRSVLEGIIAQNDLGSAEQARAAAGRNLDLFDFKDELGRVLSDEEVLRSIAEDEHGKVAAWIPNKDLDYIVNGLRGRMNRENRAALEAKGIPSNLGIANPLDSLDRTTTTTLQNITPEMNTRAGDRGLLGEYIESAIRDMQPGFESIGRFIEPITQMATELPRSIANDLNLSSRLDDYVAYVKGQPLPSDRAPSFSRDMVGAQVNEFKRAYENWRSAGGSVGAIFHPEVMGHVILGSIPFSGPMLSQAGDLWQSGNKEAAISTAMLALLPELPKVFKRAGAAGDAASAARAMRDALGDASRVESTRPGEAAPPRVVRPSHKILSSPDKGWSLGLAHYADEATARRAGDRFSSSNPGKEIEVVSHNQGYRYAYRDRPIHPEAEAFINENSLPVQEVRRSLGVDRSNAPEWVQRSDRYVKDLAAGKIVSANPVEGFIHLARVTAYDVYKYVYSKSLDQNAWSREMALRLGRRVKPYLGELWDYVSSGKFGPEDVLNRLREARLVPHQIVADIVSGKRPEYVDSVVDFLAEQRKKLVDGAVTVSDAARAYFITGASQRSDAIRLSTLTRKLKETGITIPNLERYAEPNRGGELMVRPEDAAGAWFVETVNGRRALEDLEAGRFNNDAWREGQRVRAAFGDDRIGKLGILGRPKPGQFNMRNINELVKELNAARGDARKIHEIVARLNGVGVAKQPFLAHLLGIGQFPTIDAVEINAWLTGRGDVRGLVSREGELARAAKSFTGSQALMSELSNRINRRFKDLRLSGAIGEGVPPEHFGAVVHHWLWNVMKGSEHAHPGMYAAMRMEPDFIKSARERLRAIADGRQMNANPVQAMFDEALIMGFQVYRSAKDFASWSTHMVAALGPKVKAVLGSIWNELRGFKSSSNPGRTPFLEGLSSAMKSGLLTGSRVSVKNITSNAAFQLMEEISRNPAAALDSFMELGTGRRTVGRTTAGALYRAVKDGATKGVHEAYEIMKLGDDPATLNQMFQSQEVNWGNPIVNAYVNLPFRLQGAQDRVFRTMAFRRSVEDAARVLAINEGLGGAALKARAAQLVQEALTGSTRLGQMIDLHAVGEAEIALFQNQNLVNQIVQGAKEPIRGRSGGGVGGFVIDRIIPFPKTPTNVAMRALDYTGVPVPFRAAAVVQRTLAAALDNGLGGQLKSGKLRAAGKTIIESLNAADQKSLAMMFARPMVGLPLIYLGMKLGAADMLTGFFSDERKERGSEQMAGRKPGSIRVGGEWAEIAGVSPLGNLLVLGATLAREEKDGQGLTPGRAGDVAFDFASNQPLGQVYEQAARGVPAYVGSMASQIIPTWAAELAAVGDKYERDTKPEGEDILGQSIDAARKQVMKRVPGLREDLPMRTDALGRPVEQGLYSVSSHEGDPVVSELRRHHVEIARGSHGEQVDARLSSLVKSEVYASVKGDDRFAPERIRAAALREAIEAGRDDESERRSVRPGDESVIVYNARVALERDALLEGLKQSEGYWQLSRTEREAFERSIKQDFGQARASYKGSVGDSIGAGARRLVELQSDQGELIRRAIMRAKGVPSNR